MRRIAIKEQFKNDFITRAAGERLRLLILEARRADEAIELDFSRLVVASTSFFDEAIAKLADEGWTGADLGKWVSLKALDPRDRKVLKRVCEYRGLDI